MLSLTFCFPFPSFAAPPTTLPATAPASVPLDVESQVRELGKIRARLVMGQTGAMLPDGVWQGRTRRTDVEAARVLSVKEGWWSQYTDVKMPELSANGAAWHKAALLARAWAMPQSKYARSKEVLASIQAGLKHLQQFAYPDCPKPGNWWAWEIGMPMAVIDTLTLCGDAIEPALRQQEIDTLAYVLKVRDDIKLSGSAALPLKDVPGKTDMNALWHDRLCLQLAILVKNPAMAGKWAAAAMSEIGSAGGPHLQEDYSYKFHGAMPMWAYGRAFLGDYADLIDHYHGTAFGPSAAQIERFAQMATHYANGFLYRGSICPALTGREITRGDALYHDGFGPPALHALGALIRAAGPLAGTEMARTVARDRRYFNDPQTAQAVEEEVAGVPHVIPAPPVDDIFAYPDIDFLQITRPDWAIGIKMHSSRNRGYESINGENLQGWFLSHGSMFPLLTGTEWNNVWPVIDWTRLPGTTVCAEIKTPNSSPFAGVLRASSKHALAAMELSCEKLHARKSWVVDGDRIVCIGSDIRAPSETHTTVFNQPAASGDVLIMDGEPMPGEDFERDAAPAWVWFGRMGYVFPRKQKLHVRRQTRSSDWTSVREALRHGAGERHTVSFVTGVLSHGAEGGDYAFIVLANVPVEQMPGLALEAAAHYQIESRDVHHVAAADGGWEADVLWTRTAGGPIESDAGCLLMREQQQWTMVDPAWTGRPIHLKISSQSYQIVPTRGRPMPINSK